MDAKRWLIEYQRMCRMFRDGESGKCVGCPLEGEYCGFDEELAEEEISDMVSAVEKWSEEHPLVTNGMQMEELLPPNTTIREGFKRIFIEVPRDWWDAEPKGE